MKIIIAKIVTSMQILMKVKAVKVVKVNMILLKKNLI